MARRIGNDDDVIASLMQEMGHQQGYQNEKSISGTNQDDANNLDSSYSPRNRRIIQELPNYPDNSHKAGSRSIWNPLVRGKCVYSRNITKDDKPEEFAFRSSSSFILPTNPRIEVIRRRVFEKFRHEVQTLLQEFQDKNLQFVLSSSSPRDSSSFSKNKNKLPIPSMIEKWHMDAKLEEWNSVFENVSTTDVSRNVSAHRTNPLLSTADILRERAWLKQNGKLTYDPILLNTQAPPIFIEKVLKPQVQKMLQQNGHATNPNSLLPPKFNKKAQQVRKGLLRLICEAIDSFESQLFQGAREESTRSTMAKKNQNGAFHYNKLPKISMAHTDDESESTSIVRVTFSGVTLKLHRTYLEKLQRLYDRTKESYQQKDSRYSSGFYHQLLFEEALFCLLCRYDMIQGAGLQAGVPGAVMDVLLERFDCRMECFASPLNCRYDSFASAFADVDAAFGSRGSFFELPLLSEGESDEARRDDVSDNRLTRSARGVCYEANPPFCEGLILKLDDKIGKVLSSTKGHQCPIMFIVFVPAWRDSECYQALLANEFLTKHLLLKQGEHWYTEGTQHRRKDSFRVASFDTSILFFQNESAKNLWNLQDDRNKVFQDLREAFGQDPGTMQKDKKMFGIQSNGAKNKIVAETVSPTAVRKPAIDCLTFPKDDKKKKGPRATFPTPAKGSAAKPKKSSRKANKRQWIQKDEERAQLALLESLGLSSTTVVEEPSGAQSCNTSGNTSRKKKKKRRKS